MSERGLKAWEEGPKQGRNSGVYLCVAGGLWLLDALY